MYFSICRTDGTDGKHSEFFRNVFVASDLLTNTSEAFLDTDHLVTYLQSAVTEPEGTKMHPLASVCMRENLCNLEMKKASGGLCLLSSWHAAC